MKKRIISMFMVLVVIAASFNFDAAAAKSPELNETKITMEKGETFKLKVSNAGKKITWKSSDSKVVSVKNGKLTAKKKGKATISAKTSGKTLKCKVTVKSSSGGGGGGKSSPDKVWIVSTGKKYHAKKTCSNMNNPKQVSKEDAEEMGYEPCKKCYK